MGMLERVFVDRMSSLTESAQMRQEMLHLATSSLAVEFRLCTIPSPHSIIPWFHMEIVYQNSSFTLEATDFKTARKNLVAILRSGLFTALVHMGERIIYTW